VPQAYVIPILLYLIGILTTSETFEHLERFDRAAMLIEITLIVIMLIELQWLSDELKKFDKDSRIVVFTSLSAESPWF